MGPKTGLEFDNEIVTREKIIGLVLCDVDIIRVNDRVSLKIQPPERGRAEKWPEPDTKTRIPSVRLY